MEGLFSLLLFAALFFMMMRFGCGAHMTHGHSHGKGAGQASDSDPVCGMKVAPDSGYSKVHAGTRYLFCSRKCLDEFDSDPARYLKPTTTEGGSS